jgi:hypothetical protein
MQMANPKRLGFNFGPELGPISPPTVIPFIQPKLVGIWVDSSPLDPGHYEWHLEADDFNPDEQLNPNPVLPPGWSKIGGGSGYVGPGGVIIHLPIRREPDQRPPSPNIQCGETKVYQILAAFKRLIDSPCFACFPELRDCMIKNWESGKIRIECRTPDQDPCNQGKDARTDGTYSPGGYIMYLCDNIWNWVYDLPREEQKDMEEKQFRYLMDVLIHEMVHICTGIKQEWEVECLAIQYMCNPDTPTSGPTVTEWDAFEKFAPPALIGVDIVRVGQYIAVDTRTGRVWAIDPVTKEIRKKCGQNDRLIRK